MSDRGNRWQKSIVEKKTQAIRIMFLAWAWTSCFISCAAFWHVCLAHMDGNLLSPTRCGPRAQPCGSSLASDTWVCSSRHCQITPLCSQSEYIPCSDARPWEYNGSSKACLRQPTSLWWISEVSEAFGLGLDSPRCKASCRSSSNGCHSSSVLLGHGFSVSQKLKLLPLKSRGLAVKQIKHFKAFCMPLITCLLYSLAPSHHRNRELLQIKTFLPLFCPLPLLCFSWCTMAKSSQTYVRKKNVDQTLQKEIQEIAHHVRNSHGFWHFLAYYVIHVEHTKNSMLMRFTWHFLAHNLWAL